MELNITSENQLHQDRVFVSTDKWTSVLDAMPERNQIVLMYVPFCRHKVDTGFFNGVHWKTVSGLKTLNVCFWSKIIIENLPAFDSDILEESENRIKENYSLAKKTAIDFEKWIGSDDCLFEYVDRDSWFWEGKYFNTSEIFDYYEREKIV